MTHPLWSDENWLLLLQVYLKKPVGVKPMYAKPMVDLSLELHIPPQELYRRMFHLRSLSDKNLEAMWHTYTKHPGRLHKDIAQVRAMRGFNNESSFYEGVEMTPTFETDFLPLEEDERIKPMMLIIILDLYFRLTPITMVAETPEIIELGKLIALRPQLIEEIMSLFQFCDPYLDRGDMMFHPLLLPCQRVWKRYGNDNPETLSALAAQLKEYFKNR